MQHGRQCLERGGAARPFRCEGNLDAGKAGSNRFAAVLVNRFRMQSRRARERTSGGRQSDRTAGLLDGRPVMAVWCAAPRCRARQGLSEAVSVTLVAAEHAAVEERSSRLREKSRRYGQRATLAQCDRSALRRKPGGAPWLGLGCDGSSPKREERRQTPLSPSRHREGIRAVRVGCSWGRSTDAHVGETHLVRRDFRTPRGVRRSSGPAERRAPAGGRRRGRVLPATRV